MPSNHVESLVPPSSEELCWVPASVEKGHEVGIGDHVVCQGTHLSSRTHATETIKIHAYAQMP